MDREFMLEPGKKEKLDRKDKAILELMQKNARASVSTISRKTGIPRDSVNYRIKRMEKLKIIRFHHTLINPAKIGYPLYTGVQLKLYNFDDETEKNFVNYLMANPNVVYVSKTSGKWDFMIAICSRDFKQFDDIMRSIRVKFSNIIKDYETSSVIQEYKYDFMYDLIR
jgi:Lrp/AsnC family transcriptional regulator, leucine-responsive regulatory protein